MPDGNAAAQRVIGVAKLLRLYDFDVRFCGLSRQIKYGIKEGYIDDFEYCNYPYPTSIWSWWRYLTGHDFAISEIKSYKPEIVILYNHPAFAIEHITKYCHMKGIKVLGDVTEWYEPSGNFIFRAIKGYDTERRMKYSHLKLDGLICISDFLTEYYRSQGARVIELPPLVDIKQAKWHQVIKPTAGVVKMVYAGSPGSTKDRLDLILRALDEVVPTLSIPFKFDIIGITEAQYRSTWRDNTNREYVIFNGRRPHSEVILKLLEADFQIFLRPDTLSNRAGFPTKFVETITSGTLPITNLNSNLHKFLKDGHNGFIIPSLDLDRIKGTLEIALNKSLGQLNEMRNNIERDEFDFRKYIDIFQNIEK